MGVFDDLIPGGESSSSTGGAFDDLVPKKKPNKGIAGDIVTDVKRGIQQIPGIAAGLLDIPIGAVTGEAYAGKAADALGEITGFQPSKWAKDAEAEYSPGRQAAARNVNQAWEDNATPFADAADGNFKGIGQIAKAYIQNPQHTLGSIVESLPSMAVGGVVGRGLAAGTKLVSPVVGAGIGEGAVMAGQQMDQLTEAGVDGRTAAGASALTGVVGGAIGVGGGKVAQALGVVDPETAIAGGATRALANELQDKTIKGAIKEGAKRVAGGAMSEGFFEELPQAVLERALSNLAQGKPWDEGVSRAAVEGTLAGAAMGGAFNAMPPKQEANKDTKPPADVPAGPDMPTLITDPEPIQQRIDALMGINASRLSDKARADYEKALENAFGEQVGYAVGEDGLEVPVTMGDYLKSQVRAADITRDRPKAEAANAAAAARMDALASEEMAQQVDVPAAPVIPVVGPLSAAANVAVQTGAHANTIMQQAAAMAQQQAGIPNGDGITADPPAPNNGAQAPNIAQPAPNTQPQGEGGTPATAQQAGSAAASPAGGEFDVSKRTEQQLTYLALNGKPGWKEAAVTELQKRGVTFDVDQQAKSDTLATAGEAKSDQAKANSESTVALNDANSANEQQTQQTSDVAPINEGDTKQGAENKEPNLEAAKALIQEAKDTHGDKRKEAIVRKKARELAQKTPLSDEKTVLALDMVSTRLGMGDGGTKALEFLPSVDGEQNKPASVSGKAGIDSWRSEFESAKKDGDKAKIQALYDKVRIVLNGIAQSHGDKAVSDFNALKKEIEQYAKNQQESAASEQEAIDYAKGVSSKPAPKAPTEGGPEDSIGWTSMTTVQREGLLHRAGYSTKDMKLNIGGKGLLNRAWENMGKSAREKLIAAHESRYSQPEQAKGQEPAKDDHNKAIGKMAAEWKQNPSAKSETLLFIGGEQVGVVSRARSPGTSDWGWRGTLSQELHFTPDKAMEAEERAARAHLDNRAAVKKMELSQQKTDAAPEAAQDMAPESDADSRFAKNTIFTADKVAAASARLKAKLGTLNSGIDPELLVDGMTIAGGYIESGVRKFSDYAKAMVSDLGEGVKPYLLSFYEAARAYPGLNKLGMDSQEEATKQHQALLTPEVRAAAKDVVGEAPKVEKKKPANLGEAVKLKADWGVEHIDGYTKSKTGANEDTDYGLKGGIKDEFLADAKRYLSAVAKALEAKGYTVKADRNGKPGKAVSVNEAGPAVSGDVYLRMSNGEFDVFAQVGETAVRGMGPEHPQGVSLMVRAGPSSDNFSPNNWMDTSLSAGDLVSWFEKRRQAYEQRGATQPVKEPEANELPDLTTEAGKFTVAKEIADYLIGGDGFKTIIEARKKISSIIGKPIEAATELAKQADEAIETAVVMAGREIVKAGRAQNRSNVVIYDRLVDLYRRQPNLAVRSSTSVRDQAYSTPVPLAYLASELAGITYETSVYEPTAGNGMLLVGAAADNVVANELNPKRAAMIRALMPEANVRENNGAEWRPDAKVDAVIANPPFGAVKDGNGETVYFSITPEYTTRELDHAIVFKALESLKDNGRAVLIVGGVQSEAEEARREDYRGKNKRQFYFNLYNNFNVIDHFTADGDLYSKQGASYPVDVIVINGRGKSTRDLPAADLPQIIKSYEELKEKLNVANRMEPAGSDTARTGRGNDQGRNGDAQGLAGSPVGSRDQDGDGGRQRSDGASVSNAGRTDNEQPAGSRPVSSGGELESTRASDGGNGNRVSGQSRAGRSDAGRNAQGNRSGDLGGTSVVDGQRVESGLTDRRGQEQETGHQVSYSPHSNAPAVGTLVPRAMRDAIASSLNKISDQVGDIDSYVAESLDMDPETVRSNFSAEQIDALALSIRNAEAGKGFIIGDQTGIGKGRVVAAMIRYALVNGKTPIFVTEKPNLYSDMIRDLDDIGMTDELGLDTKSPRILITNGGESIPYTLLRNVNGEVVENNLTLRAPKSGKALDDLMQSMINGDDLGDYKAIFTTYSQLQTVKGKPTTRQKFVNHFGASNYMIFDESHNAGGAGETQARSKEQRQAAKDGQSLVTGRAAFVRGLVQKAFGTFFSSATYAKRPDVMDLYSSTNMKLAVDRISQLGDAIKSGGVPMQQVVANMLTQDGQYIRRERTFAGVDYNTKETVVDKQTAENMASAMRSILAFSRAKDGVIKAMQKEFDKQGAMLAAVGGETTSVQGANFGSIMHNLIDQMLLSLKAKSSVDHAIERLKAGEKVVMTVSNTMGSFLKDYADEFGVMAGDPVALSFSDLYVRYLEKQRIVSIKAGNGEKRQHRLTDAELGPTLVDLFNKVRKQIDDSGFGSAPISPIDYMHAELRKAGYKTDEITGRTITLNYQGETPVLASRSANIKQRVGAVSSFNNGDTDVLILNQAGSTGLSLHASGKFKDKRKRHMIIVQAEKNIDTHMQMLGRVHRTGQVVAPAYSQMMADIPAEMRPASVLLKKMASLNANTTASRKSSVTAEGVVDFMNDYGGQVVHEYLRDNPDILEAVGGADVMKLTEDSEDGNEDDIRKFTGYVPILPIKQQEEIYRDLIERYNDLIERENSLGTNKLEAKAVDLDAETLSAQPITEKKDDQSVFAAPAVMEKVDVKRSVKPYSSEEVAALVKERLGDKTARAIASEQAMELRDKASAFARDRIAKMQADGADPIKVDMHKSQLNLVYSHTKSILETYSIGDSVSIKDQNGQFLYGVITDIHTNGKTANPAAGSAWKMTFAIANGDAKSITMNFSQLGSKYEVRAANMVDWYNIETQSAERVPLMSLFDKGATVRREKRWIITGNLLAGYSRLPGQIITYTKKDGTSAQGILMSRQFDFEKEMKNAPVIVKSGAEAVKLFNGIGNGASLGTKDRALMITDRNGRYELTVPSSKKDGGTYFLDQGITDIVGDLYKRGSIMSANVYEDDLARLVDYLINERQEVIVAIAQPEKAKQILRGEQGPGNVAERQALLSAADKAVYGMVAEGKSAADILKFIASASRNPMNRQIAKLLMKTGIAPQVMAGEANGWKFNAGNDKKYAAAYNPNTDTISLFRPAASERNFLHEAMHAATIRALGKKGMAAAQMLALFNHVKKSGALKGMYGMSDVDEFVAEAFTNPKFQEALKKIDAPASVTGLKSAWHWFVRVVRGILGLPINQESALSQAIEIGLGVMREDMAVRQQQGRVDFTKASQSERKDALMRMAATSISDNSLNGMDKAEVRREVSNRFKAFKDEPVTALDGRIRYNIADDAWAVSEPSKMDDVIYALQDKHIDTKRVIEAITKSGNQVRDNFNAYLQEELFHGRAAKGVKDFLDTELRPLLKEMQEQGVDMGDFEEYLWNRHAEERNKQIAKINENMPDGGSGIETADARRYLAELSPEQRNKFESLAKRIDAINRASQQVLVSSGLETQDTIDAWNNAYQHYVPLQREDVDNGHVGTGKGFSVRGSASKRAMGSGRKVVDIIANIAQQRERNIVRAEKNRVSNAMLGLAMENPNPDFWKVDQAPKERVVNKVFVYTVRDAEGNIVGETTRSDEAEKVAIATGGKIEQDWRDRVEERVVPGFTSRDNVLHTRVNGKDHYIIFNERDDRAMRMAMAMKNLDVDNLGRVLSTMGKATRYLASINTQYNPVFGVVNLIRDVQGALINLTSTPLAGDQAKVLGYTKDSLVGIYKDIRDHRAGRKPSSAWANLFEEFQKEGGQTGYRDQYANAEARAEAIKSELEQFKEGKAKQLTRGLFGWLSDYNETMENAVRLAAYKAAKEKGMSNQQAASLAKNLTVNFNRKGQMATQIGALYAFFNASVQGTARIAETLLEVKDGDWKTARLSPTGKKILVGGIMLGSMQALLLAAAGYGDDEPPEFVRERNLVLPIGDGKYLTLAMPLGFHVIPGIGRVATEFLLSGGKDPGKKLGNFFAMFADAFNPVGNAGWSLQSITPSVIDPFAALAENKDWTGKEIYREDFNKLNPTPGHARAKDVATAWSRVISEALNTITGGSEYRPGLVSWSPDAIDYLIGQATGGVGREVSKMSQTLRSASTGEDLPIYKVPLVGRFVGDTEGQSGQSQKFYDALREINMHEAEYKGLMKEGRRDDARAYMEENPATRLMLAGSHAENTVRKLRAMKRDLVEGDNDPDKVREIDDRISQAMRSFNERYASLAT